MSQVTQLDLRGRCVLRRHCAEPLGGVVFLDKDGRGTFEVELTPGDYGLICFVPDAKDGKPHLAHGMVKTITVS